MSTTPAARTQLGATVLNGTWYLDVNTGTTAAAFKLNAVSTGFFDEATGIGNRLLIGSLV